MHRTDPYRPIEDYAIIGDCLTSALVASDGSIDWACFPRFDSPSVFARILDASRGGFWQIAPAGRFTAARRYLPGTNVLLMTFSTSDGEAELADFLVPAVGGLERPAGNTLVRRLRGVRGAIEVGLRFDPRFDYARAPARWDLQEGRGVRAAHEHLSLTLHTAQRLRLQDGRAEGRWTLRAGEELAWILTFEEQEPVPWLADTAGLAARLLNETSTFWSDWIDRCAYDGPYADAVRRSALVLKLLDYAPTGAIIAAATTSLPEKIGGMRNWDYRYAWLRDTAFVIYALFLLGYRAEAEAFFDWILEVSIEDPVHLQVLYGVGGERRIDEFELPHLEGYRGSRPVRIGNAAYSQKQLDIYGDVVDCAFLLHKYGGSFPDRLWPFLRRLVDHVGEIWTEPDEGIWEMRREPQHFVYSKAICWVALDRGIKLAERRGLPADLPAWHRLRDTIFHELVTRGYNQRIGAFTQVLDGEDLDAAALAIQLRKVIPGGDPRMRSTVDRIAEGLGRQGLIHRYLADDGLPEGEGVFLMCSFWLVDCYAEMGRVDEARELFERLLGKANDVGLYAEEYDPDRRHHLGNFPQAFTHVALVNAAVALARQTR